MFALQETIIRTEDTQNSHAQKLEFDLLNQQFVHNIRNQMILKLALILVQFAPHLLISS